MQPSRNIAARAGRWSARHRKTAILGWIAFVVARLHRRPDLGTNTLTQEQSGVGDSGQAAEDRRRTPTPTKLDEVVLIQSKTPEDRTTPQFRAVVADVTKRLQEHRRRHQDLQSVRQGPAARPISPKTATRRWSASRSRRHARTRRPTKTVDATVAATKAAQRAHPDFHIEQFGDRAAPRRSSRRSSERPPEGRRSTSLPITLVILLVAFGTLVAAGIPLLLAITGVLAHDGPRRRRSASSSPVEESIKHVILLIGLAVGVDYSLFYLRRVREERAAGRSNEAAIEAAAATSGRAVLDLRASPS